MTEAVDELTSIQIQAGPRFRFKANATHNIFPGFSAVLPDWKAKKKKEGEEEAHDEEETEAPKQFPHLIENEKLDLKSCDRTQHFTKPPARFNDASLVKALEEFGIGRPSTYAPTIQTLVERHYVLRKSGALHPTEVGITVIGLLLKHFSNIMDYQFTALMEDELDKVEDGELDWKNALEDFYTPFSKQMDLAKEEMQSVKQAPQPTEHKCEQCGKMLVIKAGRFGQFLACSGFPECKYTRSLPTGFQCPLCQADVVKRRSRRGQIFYGCSRYPNCNYASNTPPGEEVKKEAGAEVKNEEPKTNSENEVK
jgi:DNA topoisomerase-1